MSRPCRDCGEPIEWSKQGGRNVPVDPSTRAPHRETCLATKGRVPDKLKRPAGHHTAAYKLKRHEECQYSYFLQFVRGEDGGEGTDAQDSGKLEHAAVEYAALERAKTRDFARPVTPDELLLALDAVVVREAWGADSLAHAREVLAKAAAKIDFSFVGVDEHGPMIERKFELPAGAGVIVGGILDLVEFVGNTALVRDWKGGQYRDPRPAQLPAVGLYAAWARLLWPELEVRVVLQYLALDHEDEIAGEDLLRAEGNAKALARAVVLKTRARAEAEEAWPASFGSHCSNCPFTARCATYKAAIVAVDGREPETLEEIVREIHRIAPVATVAEKRVKALRGRAAGLAKPYFDSYGRAVVAGYPVRLKTISRDGYTVKPTTYQVFEVEDPIEAHHAPEIVLGGREDNPFALKPGTPGTIEIKVESQEKRFTWADDKAAAIEAAFKPLLSESSSGSAAATAGVLREGLAPFTRESPAVAAETIPEPSGEERANRRSSADPPEGERLASAAEGSSASSANTPSESRAAERPEEAACATSDTYEGAPRATTPGSSAQSHDSPARDTVQPVSGSQNPEAACAAPTGGGSAFSSLGASPVEW